MGEKRFRNFIIIQTVLLFISGHIENVKKSGKGIFPKTIPSLLLLPELSKSDSAPVSHRQPQALAQRRAVGNSSPSPPTAARQRLTAKPGHSKRALFASFARVPFPGKGVFQHAHRSRGSREGGELLAFGSDLQLPGNSGAPAAARRDPGALGAPGPRPVRHPPCRLCPAGRLPSPRRRQPLLPPIPFVGRKLPK